MENATALVSLFLSGASAIGVLFMVYNHFRNPDIKANDRLNVIERICPEKHSRIDEIFSELKKSIAGINQTFEFFQRNDFHHIEENTGKVNERMAKIEGQLETIIGLFKDQIK